MKIEIKNSARTWVTVILILAVSFGVGYLIGKLIAMF